MEKLVELNILGQNLAVKSRDGEEAVRRAASYLEEKLDEVRQSAATADSLRVLLYAAFKMADENIKIKEDMGRMEEEVESASSRMLKIIEA